VLDGPTRVEFELDTDPRLWSGTVTVPIAGTVPASLPEGDYTVALWLPDAAAALQARPDYAARMANTNVWNAIGEYNALGGLTVLPAIRCSGEVGSRFTDVGTGNVFCHLLSFFS
jgi:hypothetical protein